ncbi:hypothetical protein L2E82_40107 [Cichorium intybus]|uniref:Uncharacterized protein n=1 Tax=Cichorium intybus TaxID=13427 RepID=A0ACB9AJX2_CICIN|nr:hypothetical protein L2E82_40107 [Cichorium intybus]
MTCPNCISTSYAMFRKFVDDNEFVWKLGRYMDHCGLNDSILCSESVGYFFCSEDRALLCRKCDVAIHAVNQLVSSHQRFLLTGVKVGLEAVDPECGKRYAHKCKLKNHIMSHHEKGTNPMLWQDDENRTLLTNLLIKNSSQRPKILTVEDKLMVLGCNRASEDRTIPLSVIAERTKLTVEDHEPPERQKALLGALRGQRVVVQEKSKVQDLPTENVVTVQKILMKKGRYDLHSESKETCGNLDDLATCVEYSNETGNT